MAEKIKVAYLDYSHIFAGAERVLFTIIDHLDRSKYEPIIVFPYPMAHHHRYDLLQCEKIYLADGLKWWMGSERWTHPLRGSDMVARFVFGILLARILHKYKCDILHVNLLRPDSLGWVWPSHSVGIKVVGHFRSQALNWIPPVSVQNKCDLVLCVSEYSKQRFLSKGLYTKVETLYDSIDINTLRTDLSSSEAKLKFGFAVDDVVVSSVGQLSRHKGHDNAIKAFACIAKKYPKAKLLIAGGGRNEDLEYLYSIMSIYPDCADRIVLTGKQIDNIAEVYRASDVVLSLTKVGEAFGLVPYESVWIGTPCIAPDRGAVLEFIKNGENGFLVNTEDIKEIADSIDRVLGNYSRAMSMVDNAHNLIKQKLLPSIMTRNLEKAYETLFLAKRLN